VERAGTVSYGIEELLALETELRSRRPESGAVGARPSHESYQNALRALGYELDRERAHDIAFDEMEDGYVVTYQVEGDEPKARIAIFGPKNALLGDAYARRRLRPAEKPTRESA
jgi:hypothetical protein